VAEDGTARNAPEGTALIERKRTTVKRINAVWESIRKSRNIAGPGPPPPRKKLGGKVKRHPGHQGRGQWGEDNHGEWGWQPGPFRKLQC